MVGITVRCTGDSPLIYIKSTIKLNFNVEALFLMCYARERMV